MTETLSKRERILARLLVIAEGAPENARAARNLLDPDEQLTISILEGDELVNDGRPRRKGTWPVPLVMMPQVCIIAAAQSAAVGGSLNRIRAWLIPAIVTDAELADLLGTNGGVAYAGMESDYAIGRGNLGRMALKFSIATVLDPRAP